MNSLIAVLEVCELFTCTCIWACIWDVWCQSLCSMLLQCLVRHLWHHSWLSVPHIGLEKRLKVNFNNAIKQNTYIRLAHVMQVFGNKPTMCHTTFDTHPPSPPHKLNFVKALFKTEHKLWQPQTMVKYRWVKRANIDIVSERGLAVTWSPTAGYIWLPGENTQYRRRQCVS